MHPYELRREPGTGLFVVIEGADGSGKSTVVDELTDELGRRGHVARKVDRSHPYGDAPYARFVEAVDGIFRDGDRLFRSPASVGSGYDLLSLAGAAQYVALVYGQVLPIIDTGGIAIAESWWTKTWVRLSLEVARRLTPAADKLADFRRWQSGLISGPVVPPDRMLTIVVEADQRDRVKWHEASSSEQRVFDRTGRSTSEAEAFGDFTEEIARGVRDVGRAEGWPSVRNGSDMTPRAVSVELAVLVQQTLDARATRGEAPQDAPR
ncbi:hypothetical protein AB0I28_24055 [Phytomonospora sp. NPDC050363]|uniref:hypothetical protein n=1 Tax=Phytomonospora sp. NPDC050363 TaxID=3155642 RepID=UPI003407C476